MAITKTDFMRGMQCRKMLWLDKHKPSLKIIPPEIQARLDAGNDFGDLAMGMFGPYEEMTVYRPGTTIPDKKAMLARTAEHMGSATTVKPPSNKPTAPMATRKSRIRANGTVHAHDEGASRREELARSWAYLYDVTAKAIRAARGKRANKRLMTRRLIFLESCESGTRLQSRRCAR
jgi:hypothetical protein